MAGVALTALGLSVEHVSICLLKLPLIPIAALETLALPVASSPTSHESMHRLVVHACCCCLTCLTCQVPLRSSFTKRLQQTVRSHDGLRALLGHIAHAAKTGHCHSPIMVLACLFLATYIHTYAHAYIHKYIHTYITEHNIT